MDSKFIRREREEKKLRVRHNEHLQCSSIIQALIQKHQSMLIGCITNDVIQYHTPSRVLKDWRVMVPTLCHMTILQSRGHRGCPPFYRSAFSAWTTYRRIRSYPGIVKQNVTILGCQMVGMGYIKCYKQGLALPIYIWYKQDECI